MIPQLERIRERTNRNANLTSDDFGHDCQKLLLAESDALQVASADIARLLAALEKAIEQRDKLLRYKYSGEHMNPDPYNRELAKILSGKQK